MVSAIPKHLLKKSRSLSKRNRFIEDNTTFQLSPLLSIDLSKMKSKYYYWLYINATTVKARGPKKWEKELKLENIDWRSKFNLIGKVCQENKLREFYFKLIHRLTVTKKELCIYGLEDVNNCLYCGGLDSITHTFVECYSSQTFFHKIIHWFNKKHHSNFSPTPLEKLFGIATNDDKNVHATVLKLNFCLLFGKYENEETCRPSVIQ